MNAPRRRRGAVFVIPVILALIIGRNAAENVRTVDYIQILAVGMIIGVSLSGLIHALKAKDASQR
jgi:uncharacterized membrane protein YcaP (DUF421 family)